MSLKINLNTAALTAHRMLSSTDQSLSKTIERLASGFRINSASDDPAGLVISEKLRAQVTGLEQAIRNASDAVNMVRTAEAALNEVSRLLRSMRDLAVHAANTGANDQAAVQADQAQIANAIASLNKIAAETMFGQKKLLDGSAGIKANVIGNKVISADFSYLSGVSDGAQVTIEVTTAAAKAVLYSKAFSGENATIGKAGTFYINGIAISYSTDDTVAVLRSAINAVSNETGVVAMLTTAGVIDFVSRQYGHEASIAITNGGDILDGVVSAAAIGQDAAARVRINGIDISDALWTSGNGLILKDSLGNQIVLTEVGGTATGDLGAQFQLDVGTLVFQVGAYAGQTRELNIPSVYAHDLGTDAIPGENVSTIDLLTAEGAQNAILILDAAIRQISSVRASLGAMQKNVFESSINSLTIAKENIAASESTIRDADMASEVMELTRNQILEQAGVAMLAQANMTPQTLLKLLQ